MSELAGERESNPNVLSKEPVVEAAQLKLARQALPMTAVWYDRMLCRYTEDPDIFSSPRKVDSDLAIEHCEVCPVQEQCLDDAIDRNIQDGILGGLKPKERNAVKAKKLREGRRK